MAQRRVLPRGEYQEYQRDFQGFDTDRSGLLDENEIRQLLAKQLGREPEPDAVKAFLEGADRDHDGKLSLYEYIRSICDQDWTVEGAVRVEVQVYDVLPNLSTANKVLADWVGAGGAFHSGVVIHHEDKPREWAFGGCSEGSGVFCTAPLAVSSLSGWVAG